MDNNEKNIDMASQPVVFTYKGENLYHSTKECKNTKKSSNDAFYLRKPIADDMGFEPCPECCK